MNVSVVIPTYKEGKYIRRTLEGLRAQSLRAEIVIADYNPENDNWMVKHMDLIDRYITVQRSGIAFARHQGIEAASGKIIVNFDADARFSTVDGLKLMCEPVLNGQCVLTCCENVFDLTHMTDSEINDMAIPIYTARALSELQRNAHVACLEPGSCMSRQAYNYVGGYADVPFHELWNLSHRIAYRYYPINIRFVQDTSVIVSPRRAKKFKELGLSVLDYSKNAYR